ncbi:MAG TPA: hypothetical protein VM939_07720 [Gemmatimonadaceae bacterium]|nr:hypothetical protein [Gemmatimonadaceae bacterium]
MTRSGLVVAVVMIAVFACSGNTTTVPTVEGTYTLIEENGQPLPSDPSAPFGCCLTLSGSLTLTVNGYDVRTTHRNKNNGITFTNSEQGTYTRDDRTLRFTRTGGGGEGFPYLLAPGIVSADGMSVTLLYGDEGPGSDQTRAIFRR